MEKQLQVCKSNSLIEASYRLSVAEQRIMLACIAQIRRDQQITDEVMYTVSAKDIAALSGATTNADYEELKKAALRLKRREVRIAYEPNGGGQKPEVLVANWVQSIAYAESAGLVRLRFNKDMLPYLCQLSEQFTRYALADVAKMSSAYAIRLYELLIQWRGTGERVIEIDWLREALQLEGRYPAIKDFKKWVLEPSMEQINELSPLWVKWEQRKTGRRVTHLVFTFGEKKNEKSEKEKTRIKSQNKKKEGLIYGIPRSTIEEKARPGESYEEAAARLLKEGNKLKEEKSLSKS
jgi:plasmid replication initiation protein